MDQPREKSKREVVEELLSQIEFRKQYWMKLGGLTLEERMDGFIHSILAIFDGESAALPALNISCAPHPSDKEFLISQGENWYPDGLVINDDVMLHDLVYVRKRKNNGNNMRKV